VAANRGGRPPKAKHLRRNTQLNLRIKDDLREYLDAKQAELEEEHPGMNWTRCEVARFMLYKAFKAEEGE
jgi:hypothetical protein